MRWLFSIVCGEESSPCSCTITWPSRPTTVTETRFPCALQVSAAVVAMAKAVASDKSLWSSSCALAGMASGRASATQAKRWTDTAVPP